MTSTILAINAALLCATIWVMVWTMYRVFRVGRCPVCFWGKLDILTSKDITAAFKNGNMRTAMALMNYVHLRCYRCREVYVRRADGSLERTELPIAHPIEEEERI